MIGGQACRYHDRARYSGAMPHDHPSELRFIQFAPALAGQYADSNTASWFQIAEKAFHAPAFDDDHIAWLARNYSADRRLLYAVYDPHLPHRSWHATVATLDPHTQTFAIPGPAEYGGLPGAALINAHLISGVTVRATHRSAARTDVHDAEAGRRPTSTRRITDRQRRGTAMTMLRPGHRIYCITGF